MNQQQEGGNDSWCGPASISMMYSHWGITVTQAQAASDMGTDSNGTSRGPMQTEANRYQSHNPYVWQNVGPNGGGTVNDSGPMDLYNYASDDISNWSARPPTTSKRTPTTMAIRSGTIRVSTGNTISLGMRLITAT